MDSAAYQKEADSWAKAAIAIAVGTALYVAIFSDFFLGWHWLWVAPTIFFGSSILWGMPTMFVQVCLASWASKYVSFDESGVPRPINRVGSLLMLLKNMWGLILAPVEIWIVYGFLKFVAGL